MTACGAGAKVDPTRVRVGDISETNVDPLARATRVLLKRKGIMNGVDCVYSTEKAVVNLLPLTESQEEDPAAFQSLPEIQMRVRIMPVVGM